MLLGDFNVRVRCKVNDKIVLQFGAERKNVNGERLVIFCERTNLNIQKDFINIRKHLLYICIEHKIKMDNN